MSENYGSDNILPEARKQRKQMEEQLSALAKSPAPEADSTSGTPSDENMFEAQKTAIRYGEQRLIKHGAKAKEAALIAFSDGFEYALKHSSKVKQIKRELAQAKKRLIDAEEILGELASGYWRQTLNNIDDRPTRPDWPMGELIQLYWEKQNQGEQP